MKRVLILTWLICFAGFFTLEAQNKDQVVHLKKYDFGGSTSNLYLSADEDEEEVVVKKTSSPYRDETFTLEYVSGEKYQLYCHIKTFKNDYVIVEDGALVLAGKEKPSKTFVVLWEGNDDKDVGYYRMWFDSQVGIDISSDGELKADGSTAGFFQLATVKEGVESDANFHKGSSDQDYRLRVFTSNGVFTETSSKIEIIAYYGYEGAGGQRRTAKRTISQGNIGKYGNREAGVDFTVPGYVYKVVITNKGGGVNEKWMVDWARLDHKRSSTWEKGETTLMGYWINKGDYFTVNY